MTVTIAGQRREVESRFERGLMPPYRLIRDFLPSPMPANLLDWAMAHEAEFEPTMIGQGERGRQDPSVRISLATSKFHPMKTLLPHPIPQITPPLVQHFPSRPPPPAP